MKFGTMTHILSAAPGEALPALEHAYDYIVAGNGVFVRAQRPELMVIMRVGDCEIRGLPPFSGTTLRMPRIDGEVMRQIVSHAKRYPQNEVLYQVVKTHSMWETSIVKVGNKTQITGIKDVAGDIALDCHSHNTMPAYFSLVDDAHQKAFRLYAVVGEVDKGVPTLALRLSVYGYYMPLKIADVFDGDTGCVDAGARPLGVGEDDV